MEDKVNYRKLKKLRFCDAYNHFKNNVVINDKEIQDCMMDLDLEIIKFHEKIDKVSEDLKNIDDFLFTAGIPFDHKKECFTEEDGTIWTLIYLNHAKEEHLKKRILLEVKDSDENIMEKRMSGDATIIQKFKIYPYLKPFLLEMKLKLKNILDNH